MSLGLHLGLRLGAGAVGAFSPASLFAAGEQGYWLDPSDFTTMFQDTAGTTPVTAVGQSVRRINDKSGRGNNFTQANVANAPILQQDANGNYFLAFDGTDDWLQSAATINPGAVDKAQVFAGVRKLSDAGVATLVEASTQSSNFNGSFGVFAPRMGATANYGTHLRGTVTSEYVTPSSFVAPVTNVVSGLYDIALATATEEQILRVNGVAQSLTAVNGTVAGPSGTGNFLTYTHYIGRRAGTSLPLNGRVYQMVTRYGANLTAAQITQTETFVNSKTGAY